MRIMRIEHAGDAYYAERVDDATARLWTGAPWLGGTRTDRFVPVGKARVLAPVEPSKIVCVGRNYAAHAKELGNAVPSEPLLFLKAPSALVGDGEPIVLPPESERVEHEGELGIVIGKTLRRASPEQALASVYGYTCGNDVTARDLQKKDVQFTRAKSFDTFCACGPWIETDFSWNETRVSLHVNGTKRQDAPTTDMVFGVPELLAFMSRSMTLVPGDLILTGTPEGVGPLAAGDSVDVRIDGLGVLSNPVVALGR